MDGVHKLVQLLLLMLGQRARLLVAACEVNVVVHRHDEGYATCGKSSCARAAGFLGGRAGRADRLI